MISNTPSLSIIPSNSKVRISVLWLFSFARYPALLLGSFFLFESLLLILMSGPIDLFVDYDPGLELVGFYPFGGLVLDFDLLWHLCVDEAFLF